MRPQKSASALAAVTRLRPLQSLPKISMGLTLAQLPHIARAKTNYLGIGAASPSITQRVAQDYDTYKYIFRVGPLNSAALARSLSTLSVTHSGA